MSHLVSTAEIWKIMNVFKLWFVNLTFVRLHTHTHINGIQQIMTHSQICLSLHLNYSIEPQRLFNLHSSINTRFKKRSPRKISKLIINLTLFQFTLVHGNVKTLNPFRSIKVFTFNLSMEKWNSGKQNTTKTTTIHHLKMFSFFCCASLSSLLL